MPNYNLHIDSRNRLAGSSISAPRFNLSDSIVNVKRIAVKNVQFAHTIYNIRAGYNNELKTSGGIVTLSEQFYTPTTFVTALDAALATVFGAGTYVTFDSSTNSLIWTLGTNVIDVTSNMSNVLGLASSTTGNFTTTLFLAAPLNVSFVSPQLSVHKSNFFTISSPMQTFNPLVTVPVTGGYLSLVYYDPPRGKVLNINGGTLSTLDFAVVDTASGRLVEEISHWSIELEVVV